MCDMELLRDMIICLVFNVEHLILFHKPIKYPLCIPNLASSSYTLPSEKRCMRVEIKDILDDEITQSSRGYQQYLVC